MDAPQVRAGGRSVGRTDGGEREDEEVGSMVREGRLSRRAGGAPRRLSRLERSATSRRATCGGNTHRGRYNLQKSLSSFLHSATRGARSRFHSRPRSRRPRRRAPRLTLGAFQRFRVLPPVTFQVCVHVLGREGSGGERRSRRERHRRRTGHYIAGGKA